MNSIQEYTHNSMFKLAGDTITTTINNVNKITTYNDRTEFNDNVVFNDIVTMNDNIIVNGALIINGGIYNKDTLLVLADSTRSLRLPQSTTGWAEIYIDSIGHMVSFANIYWSIDGTVNLISNGANISTSNIDNKHTIVNSAWGVMIRNRRPSSYNYSIKYHYHY